MSKIRTEADLYEPVKNHFASMGYKVRGEVKDCDIAAIKDDELIVIELKKGFNTKLLFQLIDRQKMADKVYMALPSLKWNRKDFGRILYIAKKLNIGFITVKSRTNELIVHHEPEALSRPKNAVKTKAVKNELSKRLSDMNKGGVSNTKLMTAYREKCIYAAVIINEEGETSPKRLREFGFTQAETSNMFYKNFYGWFEKKKTGIYLLTEEGRREILSSYKEAYNIYRDLYFEKSKEFLNASSSLKSDEKETNEDLLGNIDKVHTTELGCERIRKNLKLENQDIIEWCRQKIQFADNITRKGKNWYISIDDFVLTVNAHSFTVITAHKKKGVRK